MFRNPLFALFALLVLSVGGFGKEKSSPSVELDWPEKSPVFHFAFGKFIETGAYTNQRIYNVEVTVKNLGSRRIPSASFKIYFKDGSGIRIGEGWISMSRFAPGEAIKTVLTVNLAGKPASFSIEADQLPAELAHLGYQRQIPMTVYSVPTGAKLKLDGREIGITPIEVKLTPGQHKFTFEKEGFSPGTFPMTVSQDQLPGGSITFELGGAMHDTVELRDGTVLTGDVQYIDATDVVLTIGGAPQKYSRNLVKKILLVEREIPGEAAPSARATESVPVSTR